MNRIFFNADQRLRNGWWVLILLALATIFGFAKDGVVRLLLKWGAPKGMWVVGLSALSLVLATWVALRLRKEPLASVGFDLNRRWMREFAWGTAIGLAQIAVATVLVWGIGGVQLELDPGRSLRALGSGLLIFLAISIKEETLFRGFIFQRMRDGLGIWPAQIVLAALFAVAHWFNPGMHGATKFWATLDIGVGALAFGAAYLRTGSLALPIGIHLGWNWAQGHVMGFGVSGIDVHGWLHPVFLGKPEWLTGGAFGLEASIFAVLMDTALLLLLLRWKGSLPTPEVGLEPTR